MAKLATAVVLTFGQANIRIIIGVVLKDVPVVLSGLLFGVLHRLSLSCRYCPGFVQVAVRADVRVVVPRS